MAQKFTFPSAMEYNYIIIYHYFSDLTDDNEVNWKIPKAMLRGIVESGRHRGRPHRSVQTNHCHLCCTSQATEADGQLASVVKPQPTPERHWSLVNWSVA